MIIGDAFVGVKPDTKGFGPETERSVLGRVTSIAKKAAAIIGTIFVADQAKQFFVGAIQGASDLSESISKNQVVFGDAADEVLRFSENAAVAFGQSRAQALEATGVFGNLLRAVGLTDEQSADFSITLTGLASDLASFNNTDVTTALDALRAGLVGETEPLKRFGVNLNDATLKAKALELGLSDGKETLDANAKAQAAYALILEQTTLAQGDFARTSDGLANQQRILAAQWADLQAKVGNLLLPTITDFVTLLNERLVPGLETVGRQTADVVVPAFERMRDLASELMGPLQTVTDLMREQEDVLVPLAAAAGTFVGTFIAYNQAVRAVSAVTTAVQALSAVFGAFGATLLANPIGLIVAAIAALGVGLYTAYQRFEPFRNAVDAVARTLRDTFLAAVERAQELIPQLVARFQSGVDRLRGIIDGVVGAVQGVASDAIAALTPLANWIDDNLVSTFLAAADFVDAFVDRLVGAFEELSSVAVAVLEPIVSFLADELVRTFELTAEAARIAFDIIAGVFDAVATVALPALQLAFEAFSTVVGVVFDTVVAFVEAFLQSVRGLFQVGAGILRGDFSKIWEGLVNLVSAPLELVRAVVVSVFDGIISFFSGLPGRAAAIFVALWDAVYGLAVTGANAFKDTVLLAVDAVLSSFGGLPGRLLGLLGSIGGAALQIGQSIVNKLLEGLGGLAGGIAGLASNMLSAVQSLGRSLINGVIDALNDLLPNRVGAVSVAGYEIFGGLDLPDNPIPRLQSGAILRRRPGGQFVGAEAGFDEAIVPLPPGLMEGLQAVAQGAGGGAAVLFAEGAIQVSLANGTVAEAERAGGIVSERIAQRLAERQLVTTARLAGSVG